MNTFFKFCILLIAFLAVQSSLKAQDTLRYSLSEFIEAGLENSSLINAQKREIELAQNRVFRAQSQRILPRVNLNTAHGLIPGVTSPSGTPSNQLYLDPNLENDWENWAVFTQAEITALQPIYTWGAIGNAVKAAREGAEAVIHQVEAEKNAYKLQLAELYYSRLLSVELHRLISQAQRDLVDAEKQLEEMRDSGDHNLEEADFFQFYIFTHEFAAQADEVYQNLIFSNEVWKLALGITGDVVLLPNENFLDPLPQPINAVTFYEQSALENRPELKGLASAQRAARAGKEAIEAGYYPSLFLGLQARGAYTPNRPRQTNPFIRNTTNYGSVSFGFSFQQNLNVVQIRNQAQRSQIQIRQLEDFEYAAQDGIMLEIRDQYRALMIAESRMRNIRKAFDVSNEWLRMEQIDYDLGFADAKNLVDALRNKFEFEANYLNRVHDYNTRKIRLWNSTGLPIQNLTQ